MLWRWIGVAEPHRWNHMRELENAQVNFGEFWPNLAGLEAHCTTNLRACVSSDADWRAGTDVPTSLHPANGL